MPLCKARSQILTCDKTGYRLRAAHGAQQRIIGGIVTGANGRLQQIEDRNLNAAIGDHLITDWLMKNRQIIPCDPYILVQAKLSLIDHVQHGQRNPGFGNALLGEQFIHPVAENPFATIHAHNGNTRPTRKQTPLILDQIFKTGRRPPNCGTGGRYNNWRWGW
jgi:hypothetical protein